jgi:hypothetical protein
MFMTPRMSRVLHRAAIAARSAFIIVTTILASALVSMVLNRLFGGSWRSNWRVVFELAGIFGLAWFFVQLLYSYFIFRASGPVEEILAQVAPHSEKDGAPLSGFVGLEYYALILNRTFVVFVAPEGLYGWKAEGIVMRDRDAVRKLSNLKGGFFIPRSAIVSAEAVYKQKWGMGAIPHSGRIKVSLSSGKSREFVLLGSVDVNSIQQRIMVGGTSDEWLPVVLHDPPAPR